MVPISTVNNTLLAVESLAQNSSVNDALLAVEGMGPLGFFLMLLLCISVRIMSMPTTPVELAAGCLYGVLGGTIVGAAGKTFGAAAPFAMARMVGKRWGWQVPEGIREKYLQSVSTHPVTTTMALRMAPIPCGGSVKDTALGLLSCPSPLQFLLANALVYTPFSIVWASLGCQAKNLAVALAQVPETPPFVKQVGLFLGPMSLAAMLISMAVSIWRTWRRAGVVDQSEKQQEKCSSIVEDAPMDLVTSMGPSKVRELTPEKLRCRTTRSPTSLGQTEKRKKKK